MFRRPMCIFQRRKHMFYFVAQEVGKGAHGVRKTTTAIKTAINTVLDCLSVHGEETKVRLRFV